MSDTGDATDTPIEEPEAFARLIGAGGCDRAPAVAAILARDEAITREVMARLGQWEGVATDVDRRIEQAAAAARREMLAACCKAACWACAEGLPMAKNRFGDRDLFHRGSWANNRPLCLATPIRRIAAERGWLLDSETGAGKGEEG